MEIYGQEIYMQTEQRQVVVALFAYKFSLLRYKTHDL